MRESILKNRLADKVKNKFAITHRGNLAFISHYEESLATSYPVLGYIRAKGEWVGTSWGLDGVNGNGYGNLLQFLEPPVFKQWELFDSEVIALTKDSDGGWYAHTSIPIKDSSGTWVSSNGSIDLYHLKLNFPECHWEHSLIIRPEGEP